LVSNEPERLELGLESDRRVYLLKPPSVYERVKFRRAVSAAGGRLHGQLSLIEALGRAVVELMAESPPEARDAVLAKIEAHRVKAVECMEAARALQFEESEDTRRAFAAAAAALAESGRGLVVIEAEAVGAHPAYAQMVADDAVYWEIAGIEGARLFLMGWEGITGKFARNAGGLSEASLAAISQGDFAVIGAKIESLCRVSETQRKNFSSPPATPPGGNSSMPSSPVPTAS